MIRNMLKTLPPDLIEILNRTVELNRSFLVGGCVRDWLWKIPNKDYDVEVYGVTYEQLVSALARWGRTNEAGK